MLKVDTRSPAFEAALAAASDQLGLQPYYRSCVRPLFGMPMSQWPTCCAGGCEPCARVLIAVADRICQLLNVDPHDLP